jgi:hypothetical protein
MNNSNIGSKNDSKKHAGFASATAQSTLGYLKPNGGKPVGQHPGTKGHDKELDQQEAQAQKAGGASAEESGKEAAAGDGSQASGGTPSDLDAGNREDVATGQSAKSNA